MKARNHHHFLNDYIHNKTLCKVKIKRSKNSNKNLDKKFATCIASEGLISLIFNFKKLIRKH